MREGLSPNAPSWGSSTPLGAALIHAKLSLDNDGEAVPAQDVVRALMPVDALPLVE